MHRDGKAIRDLVEIWMRASLANDLETVLGLMSDDVVFLGSGRPPMRGKNAFAVATTSVDERQPNGKWVIMRDANMLAVVPS